jgi:hypothetical protein
MTTENAKKGGVPEWGDTQLFHSYETLIDGWDLGTDCAEDKKVGRVILYGIFPSHPDVARLCWCMPALGWQAPRDDLFELPALTANGLAAETVQHVNHAVRNYAPLERLKRYVRTLTLQDTFLHKTDRLTNFITFKRRANESAQAALLRWQTDRTALVSDGLTITDHECVASLMMGFPLSKAQQTALEGMWNPDLDSWRDLYGALQRLLSRRTLGATNPARPTATHDRDGDVIMAYYARKGKGKYNNKNQRRGSPQQQQPWNKGQQPWRGQPHWNNQQQNQQGKGKGWQNQPSQRPGKGKQPKGKGKKKGKQPKQTYYVEEWNGVLDSNDWSDTWDFTNSAEQSSSSSAAPPPAPPAEPFCYGDWQ